MAIRCAKALYEANMKGDISSTISIYVCNDVYTMPMLTYVMLIIKPKTKSTTSYCSN